MEGWLPLAMAAKEAVSTKQTNTTHTKQQQKTPAKLRLKRKYVEGAFWFSLRHSALSPVPGLYIYVHIYLTFLFTVSAPGYWGHIMFSFASTDIPEMIAVILFALIDSSVYFPTSILKFLF